MSELSVTEYARIRGVTRPAVLGLIKRKSIKARKIGNQWVITIEIQNGIVNPN